MLILQPFEGLDTRLEFVLLLSSNITYTKQATIELVLKLLNHTFPSTINGFLNNVSETLQSSMFSRRDLIVLMKLYVLKQEKPPPVRRQNPQNSHSYLYGPVNEHI